MFYEKLKNELDKRKLTLNQLAKGCGINQSGTSRYKNGGLPTIEGLIKICQYLNVSADYLLDLDEGAPPPVLTDQEEKLLSSFRLCDPGTKKSIMILATTGATENQNQETLSNSKIVG